MKPKDYILSQLNRLQEPAQLAKPNDNLSDYIYRKLMSKKFRKYSIPEINKITIRKEIESKISNNQPLDIHYPFGGYKLWRYQEAPEPDWAELFAFIYIARWLKPVLDVYSPGVQFNFRFDEVVISRLNNIPEKDLVQYRKIFSNLLSFMKTYIPANLSFNIFLERSRYESYEKFEQELELAMEDMRKERETNGHQLTESEIASIDLNVRNQPSQSKDPLWREENDLVHMAYYKLQSDKQHNIAHYEHEGLVAFPTFFETNNIIPIGTTKNSIVRFWVGLGVLEKNDSSFRERVLSFKQYQNADLNTENISIDGLIGANFNTIKIRQ